MHLTTESPVWGIQDTVIKLTASERKTLKRAAAILDAAYELAGGDHVYGDLITAEATLREVADEGAIVVSSQTTLLERKE